MSNVLEVLEMIIVDMESDVAEFEGKPFTGKTLGELHGTLAATIQALAKIMKKHIEDTAHPIKHPSKTNDGGRNGD